MFITWLTNREGSLSQQHNYGDTACCHCVVIVLSPSSEAMELPVFGFTGEMAVKLTFLFHCPSPSGRQRSKTGVHTGRVV